MSEEIYTSKKPSPCPFCGGEAEFCAKKFGNGKPDYIYVMCKKCKARTTNFFYVCEARTAWEKRVT